MKCYWPGVGGHMYGKCAKDITHMPKMCLVATWQVSRSWPLNVSDMFLPVSRCPCPQWLENQEHSKISQHFPKVYPIYTKSGVHSKCTTSGHLQCTVPAYFGFYWLGTSWSHHWGDCKEHFEWATWEHHSYFLWEIRHPPHKFLMGTLQSHDLGHWMYWPFPGQENCQGKFWMYSRCTGWVYVWYFVHFLAMYLWCTSLVHWSLSPVWARINSTSRTFDGVWYTTVGSTALPV